MAKHELYNANTQQLEDADFAVDDNNEIVATFADGTFVKFPAGLTADEFENLKNVHAEVNTGKEIVTPEMEAAKDAERKNSLALIGEVETKEEDTTSESQSNDDTTEPTNPV